MTEKVGLPMSKLQVDSTKESTSDLDFLYKVMPKYKTLSQYEL